jgi:branched-chain amino acid aminotransferase
MWIYLDGEFVEDSEAKVSVTDHSFLYGDGCFEGIGVFEGRVLHLDEHVERLYHSARMLRIPVPLAPDELRSLILETASRNGMDARSMGYLRPLLSRGAGPLGLKWTPSIERPTLTIIPQLSDRRIGYGGEMDVLTAVVTSQVRAPSTAIDPRIKANNYLPSILAFFEAHDRGADVGILRDAQGFLSEGHAMNLFCVRDGVVLAPMESAALAGITRKNVLAAARKAGFEVRETNLTTYDLICADEAFVTSSLEGVAALGAVNDVAFAPVPGPVTGKVRDIYVREALAAAVPVPAAERPGLGGRAR